MRLQFFHRSGKNKCSRFFSAFYGSPSRSSNAQNTRRQSQQIKQKHAWQAINSNRLSLKLIWISDLGQLGRNACSRRAGATTTTNLVAVGDWLLLRWLQVRKDVVVDAAASGLTARDHNTWAARAPQGRTSDTGADHPTPVDAIPTRLQWIYFWYDSVRYFVP